MDKSIFKSNLRGTSSIRQIELESEIIDNNLRKSYLYQIAQKSKSKKKDQILPKHQAGWALKQSIGGNRKKIFEFGQKTHSKVAKIKALMSNLGENKKQFNCCNTLQSRDPVDIYLNEFKQMIIKSSDEKQTLYFNFNTIDAKIEDTEIDHTSFILHICSRIVLKFQEINDQSTIEFQQFKKNLEKKIEESLGRQYHMEDLKSVQNFEKRKYKSVTQFAQSCETGDILLFQGQQFWGKVQRLLTNSQYDHVGMLYKDPIHGILIFQSNSYSGICLSPWQYVVKYKWYQFLDKVVWRKLRGIERTNSFIQKLQESIMDKLGKAYHISVDKLLSNQSYIYRPNAISEMNQSTYGQKDQTKQQLKKQQSKSQKKSSSEVGFFCSELVAVMYKDMQLLTRDSTSKYFKPSCNYYPYHWSQKFDLHLLQGQLSQQYIIHFNSNEIKDYYQFND